MDFQEATKVIYSRLQEIEPAHATKLLGWILMQEYSETQIAGVSRLSPEEFSSAVNKAKIELNLVPKGSNVPENDSSKILVESNSKRVEFQAEHEDTRLTLRGAEPLAYLRKKGVPSLSSQAKPANPKPASSSDQQQPSTLPSDQADSREQDQGPNTNTVFTQEHPWHTFLKSNSTSSSSTDAPKALLDPETSDKYYIEDSGSDAHSESSEGSQSSQRSKASTHDSQGRYEHVSDFCLSQSPPISPTHERNSSSDSNSPNKLSEASSPPSSRIRQLGKLEFELQELLRAKQLPVSISSLPQLYFEKYGKTLQADGYLTESQRQGKSGYSLTRLLSKMKSSMVLIDRPNGQRAVALKEFLLKHVGGMTLEDIQVYSAALPEYNEVNPSSRQIYLTFPAESIFTEEDVAAHFRAYGVVQDVRIPNQQKRMFGFVTFASHITVQSILSEGNPHYICGARVLVKPYKEKGKHSDKSKKADKANMSLKLVNPNFGLPSPLSPFKAEEERLMGLGLGLNPTSFNSLVAGTESQRLTEIQFVDAQRRRLESEARALAIQQQNLMNKAKEEWYKQKIQSQIQANSQENLNQICQGALTHLPTQQTRLPANQPQMQIPSMMYSPYVSSQQQQMLFPYPKMNLSSLPSFAPQIDDQNSFGTQTIQATYPQSPNHIPNTNFGLTAHQSGFLGSPQKTGNFQVYPPTIHINNSTSYNFSNLTHQQKAVNYPSGLIPKVDSSDQIASFNPYESVVSNLVDENDENVSNFQNFVYDVKTEAKNLESDYEDKLPDSPFSSSSSISAFNPSGFSKEYFHGLNESKLNPDANYTHIDNNKTNYKEDLLSHSFKNMSLSSPSLQSPFVPYFPSESNQLSGNTPLPNHTPCSICFERSPSNISLGCHHFYCTKCLPQIKNGCLVCFNHPSSFEVNNGQRSTPNWGGSKLYSEPKLPMW